MKMLFGSMRYWRRRPDGSVAWGHYGYSFMAGYGWGDEGD